MTRKLNAFGECVIAACFCWCPSRVRETNVCQMHTNTRPFTAELAAGGIPGANSRRLSSRTWRRAIAAAHALPLFFRPSLLQRFVFGPSHARELFLCVSLFFLTHGSRQQQYSSFGRAAAPWLSRGDKAHPSIPGKCCLGSPVHASRDRRALQVPIDERPGKWFIQNVPAPGGGRGLRSRRSLPLPCNTGQEQAGALPCLVHWCSGLSCLRIAYTPRSITR